MNKEEFIDFMKQQEDIHKICWIRTVDNSDEYWELHKPAVDFLPPSMDLSEEGKVKLKYGSLYGEPKLFETTYDDFKENYKKTIPNI